MGGELRVVGPKLDPASCKRSRHIDQPLIRRSAKTQRDVVERLDERAVDQHIYAGEHAVGHVGMARAFRISQILKQVAGIRPDGLRRIFASNALEEINERDLVFGLHRLTAKQSEPLDVARSEAFENLILNGLVKRVAGCEILLLGVEAARAGVAASGHEQARAHAFAVGDIAIFDFRVVHRFPRSTRNVRLIGAGRDRERDEARWRCRERQRAIKRDCERLRENRRASVRNARHISHSVTRRLRCARENQVKGTPRPTPCL